MCHVRFGRTILAAIILVVHLINEDKAVFNRFFNIACNIYLARFIPTHNVKKEKWSVHCVHGVLNTIEVNGPLCKNIAIRSEAFFHPKSTCTSPTNCSSSKLTSQRQHKGNFNKPCIRSWKVNLCTFYTS